MMKIASPIKLFVLLFSLFAGNNFFGQIIYKPGDNMKADVEVYDTTNKPVKLQIPTNTFLIIYRYAWKEGMAKNGVDTYDSIMELEKKIAVILSERHFKTTRVIVMSYNRGADYNGWLQKIKKEKPFRYDPKYTVDYYNSNGNDSTEINLKKRISKLTIIDPEGTVLRYASSIAAFDYNPQNRKTHTLKGKLLTESKAGREPLEEALVHLESVSTKDTLAYAITNKNGEFELNYRGSENDYLIKVKPKHAASNDIILATQDGKEISRLQRNGMEFEYKLLSPEIKLLTEMTAEDVTLKFETFNTSGYKELIHAENISYHVSESEIHEDSKKNLDKIIKILKENPTVKLEIISHTDAQGDDASNKLLSEKRANVVAGYLIKGGIAKDRLKAIGMGETRIRNRCTNGVICSDKEHEFNRRTEFRFIKQ